MLARSQTLHRLLSHRFGYWFGKRGGRYSCPLWADKDAYTVAYLRGGGIIQSHDNYS
jgi:hypothetical protein